jgi:predicted Zn finger-like uncharacterized protein
MRIHCPACKAEYQVPDKSAAGLSRARCGQCHAVFALDAVFRSHESLPPEGSAGLPRSGAGRAAGTLGASAASFSNVAPSNVAPSNVAPRLSRRDGGSASAAGRLGPPPSFHPAQPMRRPTPFRVELTPTPRIALNTRAWNRAGPAPDYQSTLRPEQDFARGSAPDLESWRPSSPSRPSGQVDREADWSLAQVPVRERLADPRPELMDRTESSRYLERRDIPASWMAGSQIPPFVSTRRTSVARKLRPVLWAAGIAATTAILGGVLGSERGWIYPAHGSTIFTASALSYRDSAACAAAEAPDRSPGHGTACRKDNSEASK